MFKTFAVLAIGLAGGVLATDRITYSARQAQLFSGAGLKTLPDPSNIWSFHKDVTLTQTTTDIPIVVDFDGNQRMDSELEGVRDYVTDIQVRQLGNGLLQDLELRDDTGHRWDLRIGGPFQFRTPLVVPVKSGLFLRATLTTAPPLGLRFNVLGRLVTL